MKQLVETVCKSLVDNPEEVKVTQIDGEQTTILELRVHQSDLGKVIGKQGRTARAIRTILAAAGMKQKRRFNLEIIERLEDRDRNRDHDSGKES
ncbi:MAG: KH domain-containing protein [bacterium]|nr:KH domain-containing protein [bacterium]